MKIIRRSRVVMSRFSHIKEITIDIMLKNEAVGIEPVIKDLAAHDMSANSPAVLVTLVTKPIVAKDLSIEVVRLKG
jgi:hypothetical protein